MNLDNYQKYELPNLGWTRIPNPPITKEDRKKYHCNDKDSNAKLLAEICHSGFLEKIKHGKIPKDKQEEYLSRCKFELDIFEELYFTDYILLVWKIIDKAREMGVFIDWGRGSVAGSMVSWLIGITGCDPIKYNLFFSRFISKSRAKVK
jgi:DNA polymerase-3 subunit alpha